VSAGAPVSEAQPTGPDIPPPAATPVHDPETFAETTTTNPQWSIEAATAGDKGCGASVCPAAPRPANKSRRPNGTTPADRLATSRLSVHGLIRLPAEEGRTSRRLPGNLASTHARRPPPGLSTRLHPSGESITDDKLKGAPHHSASGRADLCLRTGTFNHWQHARERHTAHARPCPTVGRETTASDPRTRILASSFETTRKPAPHCPQS